jgi:F0F1-type ATP synthase epsilon subunit
VGRQKTLDVQLLSEKGVLFEGPCEVLFVPSMRDIVAIMPQHTPLIMKLGSGEIVVMSKRQTIFKTKANSGVLYVSDNHASVLVNA